MGGADEAEEREEGEEGLDVTGGREAEGQQTMEGLEGCRSLDEGRAGQEKAGKGREGLGRAGQSRAEQS